MSGPGPLSRSGSRRDARRDAAAPYLNRRMSSRLAALDTSGQGSTGLTKYLGDSSLGFDDSMEDDAVPEMASKAKKNDVPRTTSMVPGFGRPRGGSDGRKAAADDDDDLARSSSISTFGRALSSFRQGKTPKAKEIGALRCPARARLAARRAHSARRSRRELAPQTSTRRAGTTFSG
jgi:hypothetical protein